jgi:hypothetical protein
MAGLWMGTAVFSALKAKDFGGFVKSYVWYALLIVVTLMAAVWVLRKAGLLTEKFSVDEIQCQRGETPGACAGEKGCLLPSGGCYKLLNSAGGGPTA